MHRPNPAGVRGLGVGFVTLVQPPLIKRGRDESQPWLQKWLQTILVLSSTFSSRMAGGSRFTSWLFTDTQQSLEQMCEDLGTQSGTSAGVGS